MSENGITENQNHSRETIIGVIKLIGELFNVGFINLHVQKLCAKTLLLSSQTPTELDIECFHTLITTIGPKLEASGAGAQLVVQCLQTLEDIVDRCAHCYSEKIKYLILDIFKQRECNWNSDQKQNSLPPMKTRTSCELVEKAKTTRLFLNHLIETFSRVEAEKLYVIMDRLSKVKYDCQDMLEGTVKIVFESAIRSEESLLRYAFLCKGLAGVTSPADLTVTFKSIMIALCQREIESQRKNADIFRQLDDQIRDLMIERNTEKALKMKTALKFNLKLQSRAIFITGFFGQLFNVEFLESRFILEFLVVLLTPEVISNTAIESFCHLMSLVAPKIIKEKNLKTFMKDNISKLHEASKTIEMSGRSRYLIEDATTFHRIHQKIPVTCKKIQNEINRPIFTSLSQQRLWSAPIKKKKLAEKKTVNSCLSPAHWSTSNNKHAPYAVHQRYIHQLMNAQSASDDNNNEEFFSQCYNDDASKTSSSSSKSSRNGSL